ncbi:hypothetical protein FACS1894162_1430 [Bacteroidia bacterium]|nr:hypothetical protein FACS1894162_1430 [Bacteroidia bacterium]
MKKEQNIDQVRAEFFRLSEESNRRFESKKQKCIQEIQKIPVRNPTDNLTRVETQILFDDIFDFVNSQFVVINEMGKQAQCFTTEMGLTHSALIAVLNEIRVAFETKINEYNNRRTGEVEKTIEQAKAIILQEHPNANIDFNKCALNRIMCEENQKRKEFLCNEWLGFIDWQIEIVQAWLGLNEQDPDQMYDTIVKKSNALTIEINRLEAQFYEYADKETLTEKLKPFEILIKRDMLEKKQYEFDTRRGELELNHLQLLIDAAATPKAEQPKANTNEVNTGKPQRTIKNDKPTTAVGSKKKKFTLQNCNNDAVMQKLHDIIKPDTGGREVAKILEALESKNYLVKNSYSAQNVIDIFTLKTSRQSITNYLNKDTIPKDEKQQIINMLT